MSDALSNISISGVLVGGRFSTIDQLGNLSPTVANPISNQSATVDALFTFQFPSNTFSDPNGDTLTYSATLSGGGALPSWLTFTSGTRTFSGTPLLANVGTIAVTVTANDGNGGTASDTFDIAISEAGVGTLIARADWAEHGLTPDALPAYPDATWFEYNGVSAEVDSKLEMTFPDTTSGGYINAGLAVFLSELQLQEVYIEFTVQIPNANPQGAIKFCKVTGINDSPAGYSNTTYQLESNKSFDHISFGDGTTDGNDVAQVINYDGSNPSFSGRNFGLATILTPQSAAFIFDGNPHTVKIRHKYNSGTTLGTEVNDGAYYVEVDGAVYLNTTNVFNRHYTNSLYVDQINFGGVIQNSAPLKLVFSNIKISTGGFV